MVVLVRREKSRCCGVVMAGFTRLKKFTTRREPRDKLPSASIFPVTLLGYPQNTAYLQESIIGMLDTSKPSRSSNCSTSLRPFQASNACLRLLVYCKVIDPPPSLLSRHISLSSDYFTASPFRQLNPSILPSSPSEPAEPAESLAPSQLELREAINQAGEYFNDGFLTLCRPHNFFYLSTTIDTG